MSTLAQMTDEVLMGLTSYGLVQPRYAQLASDVTNTGTTLTLSSVTGFEVGHSAEIGDELVYVTAKDDAATQVTVVRGYLSTTAAAHTTGTLVQCNQLWPRWIVQRAINDAILKSYPDLFAIASTPITGDVLTNSYDLPADCESVYAVTIEDVNGSQELFSYSAFRYDFLNKQLYLHVQLFDDQELTVVYRKRPTVLAVADDITTSGLADSARPYLVAQATADLVSRMDTHRLQVNFASAADMAANRPSGSANALARTLLGIASLEKAAERKRQGQQYPPVIVKARGRF
jgi:hypothetical protein